MDICLNIFQIFLVWFYLKLSVEFVLYCKSEIERSGHLSIISKFYKLIHLREGGGDIEIYIKLVSKV